MKKALSINNIDSLFVSFGGLIDCLEMALGRSKNTQQCIREYDKNEIDGYKYVDCVVDLDEGIVLPDYIQVSDIND
jgi:hypothetical protein